MNIKTLLLKDPNIKEIKFDNIIIPKINLSNFKQDKESQQNSKFCLNVLTKFLNKFYIIDTFTNHIDRRKWQHSLENKYGTDITEFLRGNALRINSFGNIVKNDMFWKLFTDSCNSNIVEQVIPYIENIKVNDSFLKDYDTLTINDKITFIKALKDKILDIFNVLK